MSARAVRGPPGSSRRAREALQVHHSAALAGFWRPNRPEFFFSGRASALRSRSITACPSRVSDQHIGETPGGHSLAREPISVGTAVSTWNRRENRRKTRCVSGVWGVCVGIVSTLHRHNCRRHHGDPILRSGSRTACIASLNPGRRRSLGHSFDLGSTHGVSLSRAVRRKSEDTCRMARNCFALLRFPAD